MIHIIPAGAVSSDERIWSLDAYTHSITEYLEANKDRDLTISDIESELNDYLPYSIQMNMNELQRGENSFLCKTYSKNENDQFEWIGVMFNYEDPVIYAISGGSDPYIDDHGRIIIDDFKSYYALVQYNRSNEVESEVYEPETKTSNQRVRTTPFPPFFFFSRSMYK